MDTRQSGNVGIVLLFSKTIPSRALEAGKALVSAFFLRAKIRVISDIDLVEGKGLAAVTKIFDRVGPLSSLYGHQSEVRRLGMIRLEFLPSVGGVSTTEGIPGLGWDIPGKLRVSWLEGYPELGFEEAQEELEISEGEIKEILRQPFPGKEGSLPILIKHGILKLLSRVTRRELPWGILTGIRPTKLIRALTDLGIPEQAQTSTLAKLYALRPDKIRLLKEVSSVQLSYLQEIEAYPEWVSLYIGIPFCPSRCSYCTFPGYALGRERVELKIYLESLKQEIRAVGEMMSADGLRGDTLYIGGGTPSILNSMELRELLEVCQSWLPLQSGLELTVEAGRPDTLSEEKLEVLAALGVTRLSINPQTMQENTLQRIGRAHGVTEISEMYKLARRLGDWVINMDLILGLPGEGLIEVRSTMEQLNSLRPDNLTVHVLALKRGAKEMELGYEHGEQSICEGMQELAGKKARSWGLRPYYLYRQKHMAGNLENIGYARPGTESRYNIAIMEERQSIIGMGAGAATKVVSRSDYTLENFQHPSDWRTYLKSWPVLHSRRIVKFNGIYPE
ncbi:MAG: coproporphyrinogen dehydrogenase HemZ [Desulfitobacteriaceae bacterium]